ncbi:unnamed protein product, partial [Prorocentrum cordatum]
MARSLGASALPVFRLRDLPMAPERGAQRDVCWRQYTETVQLHFRFAPPWRVVGGRARGRVRGEAVFAFGSCRTSQAYPLHFQRSRIAFPLEKVVSATLRRSPTERRRSAGANWTEAG